MLCVPKIFHNMVFIINVVLVAAASAIFTSFVSCDNTFPSSIERCKIEDKECLISKWNKYIQMAGSMAISELDVPILHEYLSDKLLITTGGNGPLNIKIEFRNATIIGLDKFVVDKIVGFPTDPKSMSKFVISGHCPHARLIGKYKATGKFLLIPIIGDGDADVSVYNIKYKITADTKTEMIDGEEYISIPRVRSNYTSERNTYRLDNLLNNKELSDSINMVLNESQDVLNPELIQPISKLFSVIFKKIFVSVFSKYPYRSFFL